MIINLVFNNSQFLFSICITQFKRHTFDVHLHTVSNVLVSRDTRGLALLFAINYLSVNKYLKKILKTKFIYGEHYIV
jgi:hypothetical protein